MYTLSMFIKAILFTSSPYPSDGIDFNSGTPQTVTFPAGDTGSTTCVQFDIMDDETALENDESFNVDFEFVDGVGARKGAIPQTMVVIIDNESTLHHMCMTSYSIVLVGLNPIYSHFLGCN